MPRPKKALRRVRLNAITAWKRGEKKEAYALWEKAAAGRKEHLAKKRVCKATPASNEPEAAEA